MSVEVTAGFAVTVRQPVHVAVPSAPATVTSVAPRTAFETTLRFTFIVVAFTYSVLPATRVTLGLAMVTAEVGSKPEPVTVTGTAVAPWPIEDGETAVTVTLAARGRRW